MVKITFLKDDNYILAALGVKISQSSLDKSMEELYEEVIKDREVSKELVQNIIRKHNHMILSDFSNSAIVIEDLTRFAALYLWRCVSTGNLVYGAGIETSFRVVNIDINTKHHPAADCLWEKSVKIYREAIENNIPLQDARYVLPEATYTRMILSAPPRYLLKIGNCLKKQPLEELQTIGKNINEVVERETGLISDEEIPSRWEFFGKTENVEKKITINISKDSRGKVDPLSISMNMDIDGSLALYAQLVRQRQNLCIIEPLENIVYKSKFVIPPTFTNEITEKYKELAKEANELQIKMMGDSLEKNPNFVYLLLLGQQARAKLYGSGYGVIELSKARSEGVAQWEIRSEVGIPFTRELAKIQEIRGEIGPRCYREHRCIEPKTFKKDKARCPVFETCKGEWEKSLEELLDLLDESSKYSVFDVNP